eukprot:COSAG06_NODE_37913_length_429_cov_1.769697_2_plen_45_part_01
MACARRAAREGADALPAAPPAALPVDRAFAVRVCLHLRTAAVRCV